MDSCNQTPVDADNNVSKHILKETLKDSFNTSNEINRIKPESDENCDVRLCSQQYQNTIVQCDEEQILLRITSTGIQDKDTTDKPEMPSRISRTMSCLGVVANFVLICPLVVIYWNTTWTLFDYILLSHSCRMSAWASAAIGFPTMAAATFLQDSLSSYSSRCNQMVKFVVSRVYTYIVSIAVVSQWRSIWMVAHCYIGRTLITSGVSFLVASLVLILMRCLASVSAPPVSIALDVPYVDYYKIPTFWGSKRSVGPSRGTKRLLDTFISVSVVQVAVSTYWRSLWAVLDLSLIPKNQPLSAVCSIGIGIGVSCILFLLQRPVKKLYIYLSAMHWLLMLMCQDIVSLLYSTVSVTIWRGIWTLVNLYLPFRPNSLFIVHGVSFLVLMVCMVSNSLLIRHIDRDGGRGLFFNASYVSTLVTTFRENTGTSPDGDNTGECGTPRKQMNPGNDTDQ